MNIAVLIGIVIALIVGVVLIPVLTSTVEDVEIGEEDQYADTSIEVSSEKSVLSTLLDILPYIFVAVLILGAVAFIGTVGINDGGSRKKKYKKDK